MRLGLFDRVRRFARLHGRIRGRSGRPVGPPGPTGPAGHTSHVAPGYPSQASPYGVVSSTPYGVVSSTGQGSEPWQKTSGAGRHRRDGESASGAVRAGSARARVREAPPPGQASTAQADTAQASGAQGTAQASGAQGTAQASTAQASTAQASAARAGRARSARPRISAQARPGPVRGAVASAHAAMKARLPFTAPRVREQSANADGRRHCGSLERVIWRQWDEATAPPAAVVAAIDRLAELPERIKVRLADGLDAIFIGPGGVPELDDMTSLRGVRLPSGHASWDVCAGAYGERKIVVGSRPSPTPDVMCHEIGHALDDIDSPPGTWQTDSAEFRALYNLCQPHFASDFHRQPGGLGRKEFFADAFAAIASGQRPALVDMLSGETRTALRVMLYFNRRYDI